MAQKPEARKHSIKGHQLSCPVCENDTFWTRETLMNTKGMTFLKLDWANKQAQNFVCDNCGYVHWFLHPPK